VAVVITCAVPVRLSPLTAQRHAMPITRLGGPTRSRSLAWATHGVRFRDFGLKRMACAGGGTCRGPACALRVVGGVPPESHTLFWFHLSSGGWTTHTSNLSDVEGEYGDRTRPRSLVGIVCPSNVRACQQHKYPVYFFAPRMVCFCLGHPVHSQGADRFRPAPVRTYPAYLVSIRSSRKPLSLFHPNQADLEGNSRLGRSNGG